MNAVNIKVILDSSNGTVILKDGITPVNVEIIHVDKDFQDYEDLKAYASDLQADPEYDSVDFTTADFTEKPYIPAPKEPEVQVGMVGRIKDNSNSKPRLRGKEVLVVSVNGGCASCKIGDQTWSVYKSQLEDLHFPDKRSCRTYRIICNNFADLWPKVTVPNAWQYLIEEAAVDAVKECAEIAAKEFGDEMANAELAPGEKYAVVMDGKCASVVKTSEECPDDQPDPIEVYTYHPLDQRFPDGDRVRPYWEYRGFQIKTNAQGNRFKIYHPAYHESIAPVRNHLDTALLWIDRWMLEHEDNKEKGGKE